MAKNFGEEIYEGTATFGRIQAIFSAIIGTIIGMIIIIVSIVIISHQSHLSKVMGTALSDSVCVDNTVCSGPNPNQQCTTTKSCRMNIEYMVNGKTYRGITSTGAIQYKAGDSVELWYDTKNPGNLESGPIPIWIILILVFVGILVIAGGWMWVYITRKSKVAAAAGGAAAGISMIGNAIRG
jgi:hypothetical protein